MNIHGIYVIINKITNDFYIGSAVSIKCRISGHLCDLRKGKHKNQRLQNAYNKYGEENFKFIVVEVVPFKENLIIREQYWIDYYESHNEYNICLEADNSLGIVRSPEYRKKLREINIGKKLSIEHCQKISQGLMGHRSWSKGRKYSKEHRKKISEALKGKATWSKGKKLSEETRRKMSEAHKGHKSYIRTKEHREYLSVLQKLRWENNRENISKAIARGKTIKAAASN